MMNAAFKILLPTILAGTMIVSLPVTAEVTRTQVNSENTMIFVTGEDWQPDDFENNTEVPAAPVTNFTIEIDGHDNEQAWSSAPEVIVPFSYGNTSHASIKALYSDDDVFIRVRWADDDENRQHRPWVWSAEENRYVEGTEIEDSILLSFEAGCDWTPSLLGGYVHDFDGWRWLAARSDPLGQAVDIIGNVQDRQLRFNTQYQSRVRSDSWQLKLADPEIDGSRLHATWRDLDRYYWLAPITTTLYVEFRPDGRGQPTFAEQVPAPESVPFPHEAATPMPQFRPLPLDKGAGEVRAKGHWQDGYWTVEFKRARTTPAGYTNDTQFHRLTQFSVHIFDGTEAVDQASESPGLFLRFLPDNASAVQDPNSIAER